SRRNSVKPVQTAILSALLAGCSTVGHTPDPVRADMIVVGRIVAEREIDIFEGDVQEIVRLYTFEADDRRGVRVKFIAHTADCPPSDTVDRLYLLFLNRQTFFIAMGLGYDEEVKDVSGFGLSACIPIDQPTADLFRRPPLRRAR